MFVLIKYLNIFKDLLNNKTKNGVFWWLTG